MKSKIILLALIIASLVSLRFTSRKQADKPFWEGKFESNWKEQWQTTKNAFWGEDNLEIVEDDSELKLGKVLKVKYPAGSASPAVARDAGAPIGGVNFYATTGMAPQDTLYLRYYLKFEKEFDFVKGGKLPGLYGGTENNGGKIPDGTNGFSTRYMWRKDGAGELYAYLPTSDIHGTSLGRGNWTFEPGKWYLIEQCVMLNKPGKANGKIKIWVNEEPLLIATNLLFRTTDQLKIEGIFFSTFFGGGDVSFATKQTTYTYYAKFALSKSYIGK
ncbi:MAG: hypothetical protein K2X86_16480 [Cytophagaceae bacterium]|nr:hypothetical protein [Cytophagaceae bacterium]